MRTAKKIYYVEEDCFSKRRGQWQATARVLLEALERPGSSQLYVSELIKLAEANVLIPPAHDQGLLSTPPGKMYVPESPLTTQGNRYQ